jgi:Lamin Tail Domain
MSSQATVVRLLLLLGSVGCTEYGYSSEVQIDAFQQVRRNTVDVLMVVDNSCSMVEEQDKLAANFQSFITAFDDVDVDWQMGVVTTDTVQEQFSGRLMGGDDELILTCGTVVVDQVEWTRDWGVPSGTAMSLDPSVTSGSGNDAVTAWCAAVDDIGAGDFGTPGAANPSCSGRGVAPPPSNPDVSSASAGSVPTAGEVLFTEFMADPVAVADALGEWVELSNVSTETMDLSGCTVSDGGRNTVALADGTTLEAGAALVVGRSTDVATNGGVAVDQAFETGLTLNNDLRILTPDTEGAEEIFSEMVAVGVTGSGIEMGLESAYMALSEPVLSDENIGILREDANLSLIFVSDEDDYSPYGVNTYYQFFGSLKGDEGFRDEGRVVFSAVVGADPPPYDGVPSCESENGSADYGRRYVDLADRSEGTLESICDEDFSPIAYELGLTVSGLDLEFELSEACDEESLVVRLYETQDEQSLIDELERDVDYSYVVERNTIRFEADQVPPSETWITVEYRVLASGSTVTDEGESE